MRIIVEADAGLLYVDGDAIPCVIGKGGARPAADKREGDGATPIGCWPIRAALLRPDRGLLPPPRLAWRWLRPDDGWSEDVRDPAYNRPVRHPHRFSAEHMWRDDALYDALLVLGHNDSPPVAGAGSAIFLHLCGDRPTEGCVAIGRDAMAALLARVTSADIVDIRTDVGDSTRLG